MSEESDTEKAARKTRDAADSLKEASDAAPSDIQAKHLDDLGSEAKKTADALKDQADTED